jgi:SAM-dependent methyltransferase
LSLRSLQRQWDRFGRADPLWAVLSLPEKRGGRWDEAEFFATGEREIADVLAHVRSLGVHVDKARALDFGCGVGRLARALCAHFERVDGVDIAPSMLERAARYNRHAGRCFFHLNERADLALFADAAFSFVYTSLVLQHLETDLARGYIREFLRVLAPGGLLVFHLPSEPFPEDAGDAGMRRSYVRGPLPPQACRARLTTDVSLAEAAAGEEVALKLRVFNESASCWPSLSGATARHRVMVAGRYRAAAGELVDTAEARSPLPHDVEAGASVDVFLRARLPRWPGDYLLEIDVVQEAVGWFHERAGRAALQVPCRAGGEPPSEPIRLRPRGAAEPGAFKRRHPRAHFVLVRVLRAPVLLAAAARARATVAWHARMAYWNAREAVRRAWDPPMRMNGIPRPQVEQLIVEGGGRLLEAEGSELTLAGWQAYRYFVVKDGLTRPPSRT